ncbi:MAG: sigma-70 family RNA polymerase sigma factor [Candidatus Acidiferrum sp.]|jgi:RNA polymerase sigma-70 factor, ECF subfamily
MVSGLDFGNAILDSGTVTERPAVPDDPDIALVKASQAGYRDAFGQLYQRYARMVHGILLAKVPVAEVEDLVHEVFLRALPRLHDLRDASRFGAWLAAITRNMAKDYYRQPRVQIECNDDSAAADGSAAPDGQANTREAREILEIVRSLPEAYRETLILRLVEGMTGPEIAAKTGLSHGSVRVNLNRGMQQLREKLGQSCVAASGGRKQEPRKIG